MHKSLTQIRPWEQNLATAFHSYSNGSTYFTAHSNKCTPLGHVMYHYVIPFSYIHVHVHTRTHHVQYCVWPHPHPYTNVWPEGGVVVLHVKQCLQTCCFVVFILVPYHTHIQSFSFITCSISQLCAQICPYYNVWPGAGFFCFNNNYNVLKCLNMTLHAGLANPTCLQSFTIWYCSVCESNSKKKKEKNFGAYGRIGIFY